MTGASRRNACASIHNSCFGVLSPTQTMSGRAALMASTVAASSSGVIGRKGGVQVPTTSSPGIVACSRSRSASATPSPPP
ncbi:hypothetical protein ASE63_17545 [Bosea sp. Root381]|nr:hypothetical protein ASE63_17545 [Bosea sp. Root381]